LKNGKISGRNGYEAKKTWLFALIEKLCRYENTIIKKLSSKITTVSELESAEICYLGKRRSAEIEVEGE